jgi:hypothetical protein
MKKYSDFVKSINEGSGKEFIDIIDDDKPFAGPIDQVHKKDIIEELEEYLLGKKNGYIQYVTVSADIKTSGSRKPAYLADVLPVVKRTRTPDPSERAPGDEPDDVNVFVDVEFEVIGVQKETEEVDVIDQVTGEKVGTKIIDNSRIIGMPYSLRRKGITTPIDPKDVWEMSFKRTPKKVGS